MHAWSTLMLSLQAVMLVVVEQTRKPSRQLLSAAPLMRQGDVCKTAWLTVVVRSFAYTAGSQIHHPEADKNAQRQIADQEHTETKQKRARI